MNRYTICQFITYLQSIAGITGSVSCATPTGLGSEGHAKLSSANVTFKAIAYWLPS